MQRLRRPAEGPVGKVAVSDRPSAPANPADLRAEAVRVEQDFGEIANIVGGQGFEPLGLHLRQLDPGKPNGDMLAIANVEPQRDLPLRGSRRAPPSLSAPLQSRHDHRCALRDRAAGTPAATGIILCASEGDAADNEID
jgi:hypothetical protein